MSAGVLAQWICLASSMMTGALALVTFAPPSRSVARVAFAAGMLLLALESTLALLSSQASQPSVAAAFQNWRVLLGALAAPTWLAFSLHYARSGNAPAAAGWRAVSLIAFLVPIGVFLAPGDLVLVGSSVAGQLPQGLALAGKTLYLNGFSFLVSVVVLANLQHTLRASTGIMRWRVKFLLLGLAIILLMRLYSTGFSVIRQEWSFSLDLAQSLAWLVAGVLIVWSLARLGLSEVEVYPSRRMIVSATSASLVAAYLLTAAIVGWAVSRSTSNAAAIIPALVLLAGAPVVGLLLLSDRMRQRMVLFFSRQFSRPLYDYRTIWQTFTERVASASNTSEYCRLGTGFVSETLSALSVTVWLLDARRQLSFGGSTDLTSETARQLLSPGSIPKEVIETLSGQEGVLDLDDPEAGWTDVRSRLFSSQFKEAGGHRLCVPLRPGQELVGLLLVGDRVGARAYSHEELDLLHTFGGEIGRGLLNLRNAAHLAAAREMQAFQTMSAFVIHDLKNTASTLSITLQNFRKHIGNPEFREDALQTVSGCVSHLNEVVKSLGILRHQLRVEPQEIDLNQLVRETLAALGGDRSVNVTTTFGPIQTVRVDPAQMRKVVTNLVLNARDAVRGDGRIEVSTGLRDARTVELTVQDNGCGMDGDFVEQRLFRPFSSTKKRGLGIGLYQARMIVEAHQGRIDVQSRLGSGSSFRVLLPLNGNSQ